MLLYGFETAEQTRRMQTTEILGCIQKFPDWPPGVRTANGTTLWYHYFVNQSSEFCHRNPLCSFSTSVYCCCLFLYGLSPETFGYTPVLYVHLLHVSSTVIEILSFRAQPTPKYPWITRMISIRILVELLAMLTDNFVVFFSLQAISGYCHQRYQDQLLPNAHLFIRGHLLV